MPNVTIDWRSTADELERYYQDIMQDLYNRYHTYPPVPGGPMTAQQESEHAAYQQLASFYQAEAARRGIRINTDNPCRGKGYGRR
jgi:hypothetical protein